MRHKILTVILAIILIGIIANAGKSKDSSTNSNSGSSNSSSKAPSKGTKQYRFADRADKQSKDVEVMPNETANIGGQKLTITAVKYATSLGTYETADSGKTYVVVDAQIQNTSDSTKPYNEIDFRVQTAGGQVLDSTFSSTITPLNSGDLVSGGKVSGQLVFQVPVEGGHEYLIWKPDAFHADRVIVQIK